MIKKEAKDDTLAQPALSLYPRRRETVKGGKTDLRFRLKKEKRLLFPASIEGYGSQRPLTPITTSLVHREPSYLYK